MYDVKNKAINIRQNTDYTMAKILGMFKYSGLPETLPQEELEKILLCNGYAFVTKHEGELYAFSGALGGELDAYYRPTKVIVANPWLKLNKNYDIRKDGVLIKNDSMLMGVKPLMDKWSTLLVENQITLNMQSINQRVLTILSASDDKTKESAEEFIKKIQNGDMSVITGNAMFEGVQSHSVGQTNGRITDLIEYQQWLTSKLHMELGINDQGNMKRERLVTDEVRQSEEGLSILVDNMFVERELAVNLINEMFDTSITVEFDGVWKHKQAERDADLAINDSIIEDGVEYETQEVEDETEVEEEVVEEVVIEDTLDNDDEEILIDDTESDTTSDDISDDESEDQDNTDSDMDSEVIPGDKEGIEVGEIEEIGESLEEIIEEIEEVIEEIEDEEVVQSDDDVDEVDEEVEEVEEEDLDKEEDDED